MKCYYEYNNAGYLKEGVDMREMKKDRTQETIDMVKSLDEKGVNLLYMAAQTLMVRAAMESQKEAG